MRLALLLLCLASPLNGQTKTFAQVWFKNGAADLFRDSSDLYVQIGNGTRQWKRTLDPTWAMALAVGLSKGKLPTKDSLPFTPSNAIFRCFTGIGCWVTITTPGVAGSLRLSPNVPPEKLPLLAAALFNALQNADVPSITVDLR